MTKPDIEKLTALMERLRGQDGCPWDREQTLESLAPFIIEEAYEVVAAIDSGSEGEIREELGDLLFQIIFVAEICRGKGQFDMGAVIDGSVEKMIRRHPHVFGDAKAHTADDVLKHWADIKSKEPKAKADEGRLSGVPEALPALLRAHKVSEKAAKAGFDWKDVRHVMEKVDEELEEFKTAVYSEDARDMEEEIGDILFTIVNAARFLEINPEDALRKTIGKFITRFHHIEKSLKEKGIDLSTATMDEMERLWQDSKKRQI